MGVTGQYLNVWFIGRTGGTFAPSITIVWEGVFVDSLLDPEVWLGLAALSVLEIVLGIDNLVFLAILADRVPENQRPLAEKIGVGLALGARLGLLGVIVWATGLIAPVFSILGQPVSWRDIVLVAGGVFLLTKATHEIHGALEGREDHAPAESGKQNGHTPFWLVAVQMAVLDVAFSLDSVVTAVGLADWVWVMAAAILAAMVLMLAAAGPLSSFLAGHPTTRMLALAFLMMVGLSLVAEGVGTHIPKGCLYFAMGLAIAIETVNLLARRRQKPVQLRHPLL